MAAVEEFTEAQHKRTLRALIAGRDVTPERARGAIAWLRADATVIPTANGGVRLRVPIHPKTATDLSGRSKAA